MSPYGSSSPAFLTAGQSVDGLTVENMASEDESEKWSSAIVKLCKTSLWPLLLLLPVLPSPKLPPPSPGVTKTSKKLPSAPPTRPSPALLLTPLTHTHACTHLVLYKGETTEWLQLHKHNFWQHYCTLNPTVYCFFFFFFFFLKRALISVFSKRCLTTDPLTQFHSQLSGWVGASVRFSFIPQGRRKSRND